MMQKHPRRFSSNQLAGRLLLALVLTFAPLLAIVRWHANDGDRR